MELATASDEDLATAASRRSDDRSARAAFTTLYDRHARKLLAFLAGRLKAASVEDTAQEVWQKVWQGLPTGFKGGNFRAWLYTVARNAVTDQLRRRQTEAIPDEGRLTDHRAAVTDSLAEAELHDALRKCLDKLERVNAKVADLVRARVGGESYVDFCARSGMPSDQAYRAFHQAKAQLQACVDKQVPP